ncbi:MAG: c-type cytochrome [Sideroxyarcus sp.]|nr:c-type cytochrome [Sideroxyarcus sp.]
MKRIIILKFLAFVLLTGCNGKDSGTAVSAASPVGASTSKAATPVVTSSRLNLSTSDEMPDMATLSLGESVYKSTCSICHQSGLRGAPRIGSAHDWEPRLAQEKEILYKHATHGFRGKKGSMPSRGSNAKLSEADVKAAVDYMYEHAIPTWSIER